MLTWVNVKCTSLHLDLQRNTAVQSFVQCSHTILCDTTRILDRSTTLSTRSENFSFLLSLEPFNSAFAPSYLWKSTYITFCKHRIIKNPCTSAIVAQVGVLYSIIWRAPRHMSVLKVRERWKYEVWKVGHLFSTARKPSGWEATMEKSSHLRGATMQWCSAEREVGRLHSYAQLLDCPFPLWRHKDWTSYKSKPTKSSLPRALSSTNHEVSPSSDHHHGIECPDKSPMNDIHWGVTVVHDSSQLNACLTLYSKEGCCHLKARRPTIQIEREAPLKLKLKLKQQSRKIFLEEKIFVLYFNNSPL